MRKWIVVALVSAWVLVAGGASGQPVTPGELATLQSLKSAIYTGVTLNHASGVGEGTAQPIVYAEVGRGEEPVSYYHFRIRSDRIQDLAAAVLPEAFSLAPIRILRWTQPDFYVSLAVYEGGGERNGLRAEWTTYVVKEGDPKPRVLMLEVQSSEEGVNPVDLVTEPADVFNYSTAHNWLTAQVVAESGSFYASAYLPVFPWRWKVTQGWNAASDLTYWRNGVADLQNVNGLIANRTVRVLIPFFMYVDNQTQWAEYIEKKPRFGLLFEEGYDAAIRPWVDADDPSVPLDPTFRAELLATKASVFSANEVARAGAIQVGQAEALANFLVLEFPPSIFLNFEILPDQLEALADFIPLPEGFALARIQTLKVMPKRYFLSLNIYETEGLWPGFRAEWSVYVTSEADPVPRYMVVEAQSSGPSLDSVNLFTLPADVFEYSLEDGVLSVDIQVEVEDETSTSFQATIPIPANPTRRATSLDWTEANNFIYWGNGVADKAYYSGLVYDNPVIHIPTETVSITDGSAWAPFVQLDQVLVFENKLEFIVSPWENLNRLEEEIGTP